MPEQVVSPYEARVLVVEDDHNNQLVAMKLLQLAGVPRENIFAIDGDPLPYLYDTLSANIDLILLDLQLPDKDGYTILKELRADPTLAHIRVVALTANVMQDNVERAQAAGFDGFISKPIDGQRFRDWIGRLLAGNPVWVVDW